jgi:threonine dehydratase
LIEDFDLKAFRSAQERIAGLVARTPLVASPSLTERTGQPIHLKLEHRQITNSFKLRGASNFLLQLPAEAKARGVVTVSTGNHGRGLAYAAKQLGIRAIVCMSELVPQNKIAGIRDLGAEIKIFGRSQDEAMAEAERMAAEEGMAYVQPFDDHRIIAGQGTVGLEIVDDLPEVETILVQVSGGGLSSGVGAAVKLLRPNARIIGVTMERGAAMDASFKAGHPVQVEEFSSLADSLGGGIGIPNSHTFKTCKAVLERIVLLTEAEIAEGIRHAYFHEQQIVEGAGAVGIAALLAGKIPDLVGPVAVVMSGANIDMQLHHRVINGANSANED